MRPSPAGASRLRPIRWSSATSPRADCAKPFDFAFPLSVGFYLVYPAERRDDDAIVVMREWMAAQVVSDRRPERASAASGRDPAAFVAAFVQVEHRAAMAGARKFEPVDTRHGHVKQAEVAVAVIG